MKKNEKNNKLSILNDELNKEKQKKRRKIK